MSSNYPLHPDDEKVHGGMPREQEERMCPRCRGIGQVLIQDQETDCLTCEGYGSVLI